MKTLFFPILSSLFIFILFFGITNSTVSQSSLKWYSFDEAMQKSKRESKPVLVDFYADWCSWCKEMDKQTFSNPSVRRQLNKNFVLARIDVQKKQKINYKGKTFSEREFQAALNVTGLPTLAFFDKNGNLVTTVPGFMTKDQLLPILGYIKSECYLKKITFDKYKSSPEACEK